jgi:N-acetylneuraminic acid mutarotase
MSSIGATLSMFLLIILGMGMYAGGLVWRVRTPMPRPRAGYMAGVIDGRLVIAGGSYWENGQKMRTTRVDLFDPHANVWQAGPPLPEPRSDAASVSYQDALYVFGGGTQTEVPQDALVFRHGKWSALPEAALPEPRLYPVAVMCRGLLYLVGGMLKAGDYTTASNSLWVWNPASPAAGWKELPPQPGPGKVGYAVAEAEGGIYVFGRAKAGGQNVVNISTVYRSDPQTNTWAQLPDLPFARRAWWAVGLRDRILLLAGYTATYQKEVYEYDLSSGTLRPQGEMPHGLADTKFFCIDGSVIGAGGEAGDKIRGAWTVQAQLPPEWVRSRTD